MNNDVIRHIAYSATHRNPALNNTGTFKLTEGYNINGDRNLKRSIVFMERFSLDTIRDLAAGDTISLIRDKKRITAVLNLKLSKTETVQYEVTTSGKHGRIELILSPFESRTTYNLLGVWEWIPDPVVIRTPNTDFLMRKHIKDKYNNVYSVVETSPDTEELFKLITSLLLDDFLEAACQRISWEEVGDVLTFTLGKDDSSQWVMYEEKEPQTTVFVIAFDNKIVSSKMMYDDVVNSMSDHKRWSFSILLTEHGGSLQRVSTHRIADAGVAREGYNQWIPTVNSFVRVVNRKEMFVIDGFDDRAGRFILRMADVEHAKRRATDPDQETLREQGYVLIEYNPDIAANDKTNIDNDKYSVPGDLLRPVLLNY